MSNATIRGFLITAPCPPLWNLTLYSMYCSNVKLSCDEKLFIVQVCVHSIRDNGHPNRNRNMTCSQMVTIIESCLVTSLCVQFQNVLAYMCLDCPDQCTNFTSNHSSLFKAYDDMADHNYLNDGVQVSGDDTTFTEFTPSSYVIADTTTPGKTLGKKSSSYVKCDTLCLCIIITVLCILSIGVAISITCVCRQEKRGKTQNTAVGRNDEGILQLQRDRPYRPYSYQEEMKPKVYYAINRSKSVDWNLQPMSKTSRYGQSIYSPAFRDRNSFKII